jgi:hypothetical protein
MDTTEPRRTVDQANAPDVVSTREGPPDPLRWRALAMLGTAFFMVILDSTIVLTAVPSMQADLGMPVGSCSGCSPATP